MGYDQRPHETVPRTYHVEEKNGNDNRSGQWEGNLPQVLQSAASIEDGSFVEGPGKSSEMLPEQEDAEDVGRPWNDQSEVGIDPSELRQDNVGRCQVNWLGNHHR